MALQPSVERSTTNDRATPSGLGPRRESHSPLITCARSRRVNSLSINQRAAPAREETSVMCAHLSHTTRWTAWWHHITATGASAADAGRGRVGGPWVMAAGISVLLRDIVCQSLSISRCAVLAPLVVRHEYFTHVDSRKVNGRTDGPTLPQRCLRRGISPRFRYGPRLRRNSLVMPLKSFSDKWASLTSCESASRGQN